MIGGILANRRCNSVVPGTLTVWVVPGQNLRFYSDIVISRSSVLGNTTDGMTDLIFGPKGSAPRFTIRARSIGGATVTFPGVLLTSGESVLFEFHQEIVGGSFDHTRTVNIWVIGRELFKSDFFETR